MLPLLLLLLMFSKTVTLSKIVVSVFVVSVGIVVVVALDGIVAVAVVGVVAVALTAVVVVVAGFLASLRRGPM